MFTIVYTACAANGRGDFASAVNVALTIVKAIPEYTQGKQKLILSSNTDGIEIFKKMYGAGDDGLVINGYRFEVDELSSIATKIKNEPSYTISGFVQIGECKLPPLDLVKAICHDVKTKILFVSLPHSSLESMESIAFYTYAPLFKTNPISILPLGLTHKHLGIDLHIEINEKINDTYLKITEEKFGMVYYAYGDAPEYIPVYIKIAFQSFECNRYIVIGDLEKTKIAAINLASQINRNVIINDLETKKSLKMSYNKIESSSKEEALDPPDQLNTDPNNISIFAASQIPHDEMLSLINKSIPFIGTCGVGLALEVFWFGKIAFQRAIANNENFSVDYRNVFKDIPYANKTFWYSWSTEEDMKELIKILSTAKEAAKKIGDLNRELVLSKYEHVRFRFSESMKNTNLYNVKMEKEKRSYKKQ